MYVCMYVCMNVCMHIFVCMYVSISYYSGGHGLREDP
jgi:hypothetical protein